LDAQATLQGDLAVKSPTFRAGRERWGTRAPAMSPAMSQPPGLSPRSEAWGNG